MKYINTKAGDFVRDLLVDMPRPDHCAAAQVAAWAKQQGVEVDPDEVDVVTLHYQLHEGQWQAQVVNAVSLTQAVIDNWQGESTNDAIGALLHTPWAGDPPPEGLHIVEQLHRRGPLAYGDDYQVFNGLYRRTRPARYDAQTLVKLPAEGLQRFIWTLDFHTPYRKRLDTFWRQGLEHYRSAALANFVAASNKQFSEGSLSLAAQQLTWQVAGLVARQPAVQVRPLNIYGYAATDILCMSNQTSGLTLLYLPGNTSPLHEFVDEPCMKLWLAAQCRDSARRDALQAHFAPGDRDDGLSYSGLTTALRGLGRYPEADLPDADHHPGFATSGVWAPGSTINYRASHYSRVIEGDVFEALAHRKKKRAYQDADYLIDTDTSVTKAKWRHYLSSAINTLAPVALIVPELAPLFAAGGVAQFGLGLDQALRARSLAGRQQGFEEQVYGLFNALPLAHSALGEGSIFRVEKSGWVPAIDPDRFVPPSRVNGRIGYPLSPVRPTRLPLSPAQMEAFFSLPDHIAPLSGADAQVAGAVVRQPGFDGGFDRLQSQVGGYLCGVTWDVNSNTFVLNTALNDVEPAHWVPNAQGVALTPAQALSPATDAERQATLRALGVDLELPVDLPALLAQDATPIPAKISSIWLGDQTLSAELLENLGANSAIVKDTRYEYRLYLSRANPQAWAENVRLLGEHAPDMKIITLENDPLYTTFANSPYFEQYEAAIDGAGGKPTNYASACDVLRYRVLHAEGGLYMDVDDSLIAPGQRPELDGQAFGDPAPHLDDVALLASADGMVLPPPVSSELMGMNHQYNNSFMGSHPGNPTLDAISDEMLARYRGNEDFYHHRPNLDDDPRAFGNYARRLSYLTGPKVLDDVLKRRLPQLERLSQLRNFIVCPTLNGYLIVDKPALAATFKQCLPLNRIGLVRSTLSWKHS